MAWHGMAWHGRHRQEYRITSHSHRVLALHWIWAGSRKAHAHLVQPPRFQPPITAKSFGRNPTHMHALPPQP